MGRTLAMLPSKGLSDLTYSVDILDEKKITYFFGVPSYLSALCHRLDDCSKETCLKHIRSVVARGSFILHFPKLIDCDRNVYYRKVLSI